MLAVNPNPLTPLLITFKLSVDVYFFVLSVTKYIFPIKEQVVITFCEVIMSGLVTGLNTP